MSKEPGAHKKGLVSLSPMKGGGFCVEFNDGIHWAKQNRCFGMKSEAVGFATTFDNAHLFPGL